MATSRRCRRTRPAIDNAFDRDHIRAILNRNALAQETMSADRLFAVKEEMEKAEARRLQPYFVRSFFMKAFEALGGSIHPREAARFEITTFQPRSASATAGSPGAIGANSPPSCNAMSAFVSRTGSHPPLDEPPALRSPTMIHPGHPLMLAMSELVVGTARQLAAPGHHPC